jgi:hypothetical protein
VLANLVHTAGAKFFLMGWKTGRERFNAGRPAARSDLVKPLQFHRVSINWHPIASMEETTVPLEHCEQYEEVVVGSGVVWDDAVLKKRSSKRLSLLSGRFGKIAPMEIVHNDRNCWPFLLGEILSVFSFSFSRDLVDLMCFSFRLNFLKIETR